MAYITLGTAQQLVIKVPTLGSTDWGDTLRTDTFLKIAEHDHSGSGSGTPLSTGAISADAITGAKIRLDNDEYIRARNFANSGDISTIKIGTDDKLVINPEISTVVKLSNNIALQHRNAADSAYVSTILLNASDKIALGADLANLAIINDTFLTGRNNADSAYINLLKVNTSDKIAVGADLANAALVNNVSLQHRNAADSAYIETLKVNASDKIELGANVVSANIETASTSLINTLASAVTLADNQAATTAGIVTLSTDESCAVHYRIVRNGVTQSGVVRFNDVDTVPSESFHGTDVGVTFTVNAGDLEYATTSTGNTASMTYVVIKE